jgi:hypothetical protein
MFSFKESPKFMETLLRNVTTCPYLSGEEHRDMPSRKA